MAVPKVKIELTPYNAMSILAFLREWVNDDVKGDYEFKAICEAVDQYEKEVASKMTDEQFDDMHRENVVNQLIGKSPKRKGVV